MKKEVESKPEITTSLIRNDGRIVEMIVKKVVKKAGTGAHILVPAELVGKYVTITYREKDQ